MWKLLTRAFQRCITLYSQKWTVWPWEAIFCKKLPEKQLFWATRIWIKWLWAAITPVQNLQISKTTTFSESSGRQLSDELLGRPLASILSDRRPLENFLGSITKKFQKMIFFTFGQITRVFELVWPIQARTMWKLTSWGFRKCGSFRDLEVLNRSYGCSKSEDFEILSPLPKIRGVAKKQHSVNIEFLVPKLKLVKNNPIGYIEFEFRASNLKIGRVLFFCDAYFFFWIWPDFDSL